jgi:hypothetical protein
MEDILRSKVSDVKTGEMSLGKKEALRFLIHFIGDIHQPLHVGNGKDRGANQCLVKWFGEMRKLNSVWSLHSVWDEGLVESFGLSFSELSRFVDRDLNPDRIAAIQNSKVIDWANESKAIRPDVYPQPKGQHYEETEFSYCKKYQSAPKYNNASGFEDFVKQATNDPEVPDLSYDYKFKWTPIVKERLLKAGLRLAGELNSIFGGSH